MWSVRLGYNPLIQSPIKVVVYTVIGGLVYSPYHCFTIFYLDQGGHDLQIPEVADKFLGFFQVIYRGNGGDWQERPAH